MDRNIARYEASVSIWNRYNIETVRVESVADILCEVKRSRYELVVLMEEKDSTEALRAVPILRAQMDAPIVLSSDEVMGVSYKLRAFDVGCDEVWTTPKEIREAVAKGHALIRRFSQARDSMHHASDSTLPRKRNAQRAQHKERRVGLGDVIRQYREDMHMSVGTLSDRLQMPASFVTMMEAGQLTVSLRVYAACVRMLGIPMEALLNELLALESGRAAKMDSITIASSCQHIVERRSRAESQQRAIAVFGLDEKKLLRLYKGSRATATIFSMGLYSIFQKLSDMHGGAHLLTSLRGGVDVLLPRLIQDKDLGAFESAAVHCYTKDEISSHAGDAKRILSRASEHFFFSGTHRQCYDQMLYDCSAALFIDYSVSKMEQVAQSMGIDVYRFHPEVVLSLGQGAPIHQRTVSSRRLRRRRG